MKAFGKIFLVLAVVASFSGVAAFADGDVPCEASNTKTGLKPGEAGVVGGTAAPKTVTDANATKK